MTESGLLKDPALVKDPVLVKNPALMKHHGVRARFRGAIGRDFLLDAAFEAPSRGFTALFGPSGCGKTTVLRCMAGLRRMPDGFFALGDDVWQDGARFLPAHRRSVGYVFQEASLFPHLSVKANLLFGARRAHKAAGRLGSFDDIVDLLGLSGRLERATTNLSGGERQRVAIGRALLAGPDLLLMDEPLSALDRAAKDEILPFLEKLRDSFDLPTLFVTHDMREVERLASHIVLMETGRVIGAGPLETLQSDLSLPLASGRDAAVILDGVVADYDAHYGLLTLDVGGVRFIAPAPEEPRGRRRRLRVAASDVSISTSAGRDSTILNAVAGRVAELRVLDKAEAIVVVAIGDKPEGAGRLLARVTRRSLDGLALAPGMPVYAHVKSVALTR